LNQTFRNEHGQKSSAEYSRYQNILRLLRTAALCVCYTETVLTVS